MALITKSGSEFSLSRCLALCAFIMSAVASSSWATEVNVQEITGSSAETSETTITQAAAHEGEQWFTRMQQTLKSSNYAAHVVHVQGERLDVYQWMHGVDSSGAVIEVLSSLNGPQFQALRKNQQVAYYHPMNSPYSLRSSVIQGPVPVGLHQDFSQISQSYNAVAVGGGRVADRPAQHIRLVAKDQARYGYSIWVDRDSGMLLRVAMVSQQGDVLEQTQVTSFEMRAEPHPDLLELSHVAVPPVFTDHPGSTQVEGSWSVSWMPDGFRLIRSNNHSLPVTGSRADYFLYSDGMAEFSVFVTEGSEAAEPMAYESLNSLFTVNHGDFSVTVVGRLPFDTIQRIASSVGRSQ